MTDKGCRNVTLPLDRGLYLALLELSFRAGMPLDDVMLNALKQAVNCGTPANILPPDTNLPEHLRGKGPSARNRVI
ncbi:MAG: hypothetical protein HQL50_15120 [Magnetococcales bacterium]|nr:hypothetical protein [Magnetococcales bacterium]